MLIGLFVLVACALTILTILFLKPRVGDEKKTYYVRFADINKISVGTRVTFAGKPVGEVVGIKIIYHAREEPTDSVGATYYYELTIKVDSSVTILNCDQLSLQTSGLLGEKSVAISPKRCQVGFIPKPVPQNQPIYGESADPLEKAIAKLTRLAVDLDKTVNNVTEWLENNEQAIACSIKSFGNAMDELQCAISTINKEHVIEELKESLQNFSQFMCSLNDGMDDLKEQNTFENIGTMVNNFTNASQSIDTVSKDLANGTGTLGKLIKKDDLYLRLNAIMSKMNTLMNDINHYGLTFNLNKRWQRTRTQRMDFLNALDTPSEFKSYFETEVDQINTAMSRLSMLVEKANESPRKEEIFQSECFKQEFRELMQEVDELSGNLRLYNEELIDGSCSWK